MSYILDALRRADAERQRGQVPGLHAAAPGADALPAPRARRWVLAFGVVGGLAAGALLALWLRGTSFPNPAPAPLASAPVASTPAAPAQGPAVALPAPLNTPTQPAVTAAAPAPRPAATPRAMPAPATSSPVAAPGSVPPVRPAELPLIPLARLDPGQRRELPALVPGGSVYSESAASRFVILDGQLLREGDAVVSGLVVERIGPRSCVLRWRGQRLELPL